MTPEVMESVMSVCQQQASRFPEFACLGRDDMVSAALERLVRSSRQYHAEDMALVAVVARRAIVDEMRKQKIATRKKRVEIDENGNEQVTYMNHERTFSLDSSPTNSPGLTLGDMIPVEDDYRELDHLLLPLTDRERYIVLRMAQGYNMREIGEELDITESRVSQIVGQARYFIELWDLDSEGARSSPGLRERLRRSGGSSDEPFAQF